MKNRKRKADEPTCPVCSERLSGTPEELNQHVERCLNKHNNGNPAGQHSNLDEEEVDVEGDAETFEEYEWAGQRRVRATSMLVGGFSGEFFFSNRLIFYSRKSLLPYYEKIQRDISNTLSVFSRNNYSENNKIREVNLIISNNSRN